MDSIPRDQISIKAVRASGPGGQHINKSASKVELRFCVTAATSWLDKEVLKRFIQQNQHRINQHNEFVITCSESRSQLTNIETGIEKINELIKIASIKPKTRKKTKPRKSSIIKRLDNKSKTSTKKELRKKVKLSE